MGVFGPHAHSEPPILLCTKSGHSGAHAPSQIQRTFSMFCSIVQVSIVEHYQHYFRYLERGGADNIYGPWASPEDSRQNCQGWCKSWMYWGYSGGPLPWWGKCYDAANSLNNVVVAIAYNELIPPATKRMVNETQCNRMNSSSRLKVINSLRVEKFRVDLTTVIFVPCFVYNQNRND